jgi:hypothetical protein
MARNGEVPGYPRPWDLFVFSGPPGEARSRQCSTKYAPCPWPLEKNRLVTVFLRV